MKSRFSIAILILCSFMVHSAVAAQERNVDEILEDGLALREQGQDEAALARFEEAESIEPTGRSAAQIGLALQALGRFAEAHRTLDEAISRGGEWIDRYEEHLVAAQAMCEEHIGELFVVSNIPGELSLNGAHAGELPLEEPILVDAGTVVIRIEADGYYAYETRLQVDAGSSVRRDVTLVERGENEESAERPNGTANRRGGALAATILGAGMLVGGGTLFAIMAPRASAEFDRLEAECGAAQRCREGDDDELRRLSLMADIGLGIGIAGALTTAISLPIWLARDTNGRESAVRVGVGRLELTGSF